MNTIQKVEEITGISLKTFFVTLLATLLFGLYIKTLMFGENSLSVLEQLQKKKASLKQEERRLKHQNQALQKTFFELKQLEPKE